MKRSLLSRNYYFSQVDNACPSSYSNAVLANNFIRIYYNHLVPIRRTEFFAQLSIIALNNDPPYYNTNSIPFAIGVSDIKS